MPTIQAIYHAFLNIKSLKNLCVYACILWYVEMCLHVCGCICVCIHVEARWLASGIFLHSFLLVSLGFTKSANLASQPTLGISSLFLGLQVSYLTHRILYVGAGDLNLVLFTYMAHTLPTGISLQPHHEVILQLQRDQGTCFLFNLTLSLLVLNTIQSKINTPPA